jgi:hypothetical protein
MAGTQSYPTHSAPSRYEEGSRGSTPTISKLLGPRTLTSTGPCPRLLKQRSTAWPKVTCPDSVFGPLDRQGSEAKGCANTLTRGGPPGLTQGPGPAPSAYSNCALTSRGRRVGRLSNVWTGASVTDWRVWGGVCRLGMVLSGAASAVDRCAGGAAFTGASRPQPHAVTPTTAHTTNPPRRLIASILFPATDAQPARRSCGPARFCPRVLQHSRTRPPPNCTGPVVHLRIRQHLRNMPGGS